MAQEGYLFIRALLPTEAVATLYDQIAGICRKYGWMDDDGYAQGEPRLEGKAEFWEVYDEVQCLEEFHALAHHPSIIKLIRALVQEEVLVHPRHIARIAYPRAEFFTTPPHQDHVLIQGTPETYTFWMPLLDCPRTLGGLAVLPGSHTIGLLDVHQAEGPGGVGVTTDGLGLTWRTNDLQRGDVLLFHSHTVHKALPNISGNRLRISVDYRYQGASQPVVEDGLLPHYGRLTWDQIYQNWTRQELQYYWEAMDVQAVPRDPSLREAKH
jgi:ectoine hydroxylase-related dioxygenase (phytanoyl-CoA dioxygenase family)